MLARTNSATMIFLMPHSPFAVDVASADRGSGPPASLFGHPGTYVPGSLFVDCPKPVYPGSVMYRFRSGRKRWAEAGGPKATKP
jgi:hypothetical protein